MGLLLGLDFGGTKVDIALASSPTDIITRVRLPTKAAAGARQALERAISSCLELTSAAGSPPIAVGVSTMGITRESGVSLAPNVPGWADLRLPDELRAAFPDVPWSLDNDVKAAALAELRHGALRGTENALYVSLGTGIAAALIIDGRVVRGTHGAAGEIGYWSYHGHRGGGIHEGHAPFEEYAGGLGVGRRISEATHVSQRDSEDRGESSLISSKALSEAYDEIAARLSDLAICMDSERVVLGGGYTRTPAELVTRVHARMTAYVPFPPDVTVGRFADHGGLAGALTLAEQAAGHEIDDPTHHAHTVQAHSSPPGLDVSAIQEDS